MNGKIVVVFIVVGTAILATGLTMSGLRAADPHGCFADLPRASQFPFSTHTEPLNGSLENTTLRLPSIGAFHVTIEGNMRMVERPYQGERVGQTWQLHCDQHRIDVRVDSDVVTLAEFSLP